MTSNIKRNLTDSFVKFMNLFAFRCVTVIGSSHVRVFNHYTFKLFFPYVLFDVCSVTGATASGLKNPNSKTQAYTIFSKKLRSMKPGGKVIVMLGEIDTGFLIWYRAQKYNTSVSEILEYTVNKYINFLKEINVDKTLIVISAPLPTIKDYGVLGEVANLRKSIKVNQFERTSLALRFNGLVREKCPEYGITFVDMDKESLGEDGLVKQILLSENKKDHHYNPKVYSKLLCLKLNGLI